MAALVAQHLHRRHEALSSVQMFYLCLEKRSHRHAMCAFLVIEYNLIEHALSLSTQDAPTVIPFDPLRLAQRHVM